MARFLPGVNGVTSVTGLVIIIISFVILVSDMLGTLTITEGIPLRYHYDVYFGLGMSISIGMTIVGFAAVAPNNVTYFLLGVTGLFLTIIIPSGILVLDILGKLIIGDRVLLYLFLAFCFTVGVIFLGLYSHRNDFKIDWDQLLYSKGLETKEAGN